VLYADDSRSNQHLMSTILAGAGAEVTTADNGQLALLAAISEAAQGRPFDIILLVMQLRIVVCYEATRRLRNLGFVVPIIAATSQTGAEARAACLAAGCDDFLPKPIDAAAVIATVGRFCRAGSAIERPSRSSNR
jgi:CheY-like chemotaxis protein